MRQFRLNIKCLTLNSTFCFWLEHARASHNRNFPGFLGQWRHNGFDSVCLVFLINKVPMQPLYRVPGQTYNNATSITSCIMLQKFETHRNLAAFLVMPRTHVQIPSYHGSMSSKMPVWKQYIFTSELNSVKVYRYGWPAKQTFLS